MLPYLKDNGYKCPRDQTRAPLHYAFETNLPVYDYWDTLPGVRDNFNLFMTGARASRPAWMSWFPVEEEVLQGTENDKENPLIVDIGGGRGQDLAAFEQKFPDTSSRLVLQDLPSVIAGNSELKGIEQMGYDFFNPQPIHGKWKTQVE